MTRYNIPIYNVYTVTTLKEVDANTYEEALAKLEEAGEVVDYKALLDRLLKLLANADTKETIND